MLQLIQQRFQKAETHTGIYMSLQINAELAFSTARGGKVTNYPRRYFHICRPE